MACQEHTAACCPIPLPIGTPDSPTMANRGQSISRAPAPPPPGPPLSRAPSPQPAPVDLPGRESQRAG
eukprot:scaffold191071_cov21-Tisochrysis_lutea.AAC.1